MMTRPLKIVTYNIHKGLSPLNRNLVIHELATALRQVRAELVLLQEVQGLHELRQRRFRHWPENGQADFLGSVLRHIAVYGSNASHRYGHHGNAILSSHAVTTWRNVDISMNRLERRGVLHAELTVPGWETPLHAMCVHLNLLARDRRKQLRLLRDEISNKVPAHAPLIVAGDFNDWRNEAQPLLMHEMGMQEAFESVFGKPAKSFPVRWPVLRLDRIYTRGLTTVHAEVGEGEPWSLLSDHAPLLAWVMPTSAINRVD